VRWNAIAVLAAGIAVLAGCGGNPGYHQTVPGRFVRAGGPAPGSPVPLPGTITARTATGETFTATAGRVGRFTLSLPPGTYRVTGRSPLMQSGQMICAATAELHVSPVSLRAPSPWSARFPSRRVRRTAWLADRCQNQDRRVTLLAQPARDQPGHHLAGNRA
jgi:hypothetical protein